jgi:ATP-binding cassette, subfamily B, bacterial CvaB/MchF/RaxB
MDAELALRTRGLSVDLGERRVLDDVTLDVPRGAVVGLVGPNGAGKTTLLRAIVGMLPVASGTIELGGTASYMPQLGPGAWDFPLDALEVALQGSYRRAGWLRRPSRRERGRAMDALAGVGMDGLARRQVGELSGGQRQRVLLARALYRRPRMLFMDEGTSHLDLDKEREVNRALAELKITRIVIAHRPETIRAADRIVVLREGRVSPPLDGETLAFADAARSSLGVTSTGRS